MNTITPKKNSIFGEGPQMACTPEHYRPQNKRLSSKELDGLLTQLANRGHWPSHRLTWFVDYIHDMETMDNIAKILQRDYYLVRRPKRPWLRRCFDWLLEPGRK